MPLTASTQMHCAVLLGIDAAFNSKLSSAALAWAWDTTAILHRDTDSHKDNSFEAVLRRPLGGARRSSQSKFQNTMVRVTAPTWDTESQTERLHSCHHIRQTVTPFMVSTSTKPKLTPPSPALRKHCQVSAYCLERTLNQSAAPNTNKRRQRLRAQASQKRNL